jgi:hypothetical protein
MLDSGYGFDFFSDRQLQKFTVANKKIIAGGNAYQVILLPANTYIPASSFQKLFDLARAGAQIVFYKSMPIDVPGYGNYDTHNKFSSS